jgi:toxin ParE1/3/4
VKDVRIVLSELAVADILEQADWYEAQADQRLASRWEQSVTSALLRISRSPKTGALCKFSSEELKGTRRLPVTGFAKHLISYQAQKDRLLILRVIHGARDLENLFS